MKLCAKQDILSFYLRQLHLVRFLSKDKQTE